LKISNKAFSPGKALDVTPASRMASEKTAPDAPVMSVRSRSKMAAAVSGRTVPLNGKGPTWGTWGLSTWDPCGTWGEGHWGIVRVDGGTSALYVRESMHVNG